MHIDDFIGNFLKTFDGTATMRTRLNKLYHGGQRKLWKIGQAVVVSEIPYNGPNKETPFDQAQVHEYLKKKTTIPIPSIYHEWDEEADEDEDAQLAYQDRGPEERSKWHYCLRQYIPGVTLESAWGQLSAQQRNTALEDVCGWLQQLRGTTERYLGRVNRQPLVDHLLFNTLHFDRHGPFENDEDLFRAMAGTLRTYRPLRSELITDKVLNALWQHMPRCKPYTYTHGDLSPSNIIWDPDQGRVVALLDWEWSGFFPRWWEYAKVCRARDRAWRDVENKVGKLSPDAMEPADLHEWYKSLAAHMEEHMHPLDAQNYSIQTGNCSPVSGHQAPQVDIASPGIRSSTNFSEELSEEMDTTEDEYTEDEDYVGDGHDMDYEDGMEDDDTVSEYSATSSDGESSGLWLSAGTCKAVQEFMGYYNTLINYVASDYRNKHFEASQTAGVEAIIKLQNRYEELKRLPEGFTQLVFEQDKES